MLFCQGFCFLTLLNLLLRQSFFIVSLYHYTAIVRLKTIGYLIKSKYVLQEAYLKRGAMHFISA